jgi:hypothetical protein
LDLRRIMSFSDIVSVLSSSFPVRITRGVHQFKVKNVHLQLMGNDETLTAMVTPGAPFASHLRSMEGGELAVVFKEDAPQSVGFTGFDGNSSLMFRDVPTFDEAPTLLKTLLLIIDFENHLREMVCDLWDRFIDPRWSITIQPTSALEITHARGGISLTHAGDSAFVFACPLAGVYDRFVVWDGPHSSNHRTGTLVLGKILFAGVQEEDGGVLSFSYTFPDDEDAIHQVLAALVWIFRVRLEDK